jgi:pilus assembly protein CpaF
MFSILISEKGGSERREHYDRAELSVGRVQGNDLMLPKGNVSKRHARLLYREGRFIVTDLKSTNGTYVNGRKIAQATIVREGDKIYIGDFVLRIENPQTSSSQQQPPSASTTSNDVAEAFEESSSDGISGPQPAAPSHAGPLGSLPPSPRTSAPRITSMPSARGFISHFPLERDPDESEPAYVPAPPRVPTGPRMSLQSERPHGFLPAATPTRATAPSPGASDPPPRFARAAPTPPVDLAAQARRRALLGSLIQRASTALGEPIAAQVSAELSRRLTDVLGIQAGLMMAAGELPGGVETDTLIAEATRELVGTGPLEALLADEDVQEIHVAGHDHVSAMTTRGPLVCDVAFTSEAALVRALDRLCRSAGQPISDDEVYVDRRLGNGVRLFAIVGRASSTGHMAVLRKPQQADLSLGDLIHGGAISPAIGDLLRLAVMGRANVLVTGSRGAGTTSLVSALAAAGRTDDRVIALQDDDELVLHQPHTVSILLESTTEARAHAVRAAVRLLPDRLVVGSFSGVVAAEVIDAIDDGLEGVLAAAHGPTIRQTVLRLAARLTATRDGLAPDAALEGLVSALDLAVEIARFPDGQHRVTRIAELSVEANALVVRDVFTFAVERSGNDRHEGTFQATGLVPRFVESLEAKGVFVDASIFKRSSSR